MSWERLDAHGKVLDTLEWNLFVHDYAWRIVCSHWYHFLYVFACVWAECIFKLTKCISSVSMKQSNPEDSLIYVFSTNSMGFLKILISDRRVPTRFVSKRVCWPLPVAPAPWLPLWPGMPSETKEGRNVVNLDQKWWWCDGGDLSSGKMWSNRTLKNLEILPRLVISWWFFVIWKFFKGGIWERIPAHPVGLYRGSEYVMR